METQTIQLSGTTGESIVDGYGLRYVIFTQGCPHRCMGCHNPSTHRFDGGYTERIDKLFGEIAENPLLSGVTFSGGEPFCQSKPLYALAKKIRDNTPLDITIYTGYTFEELLALKDTDVQNLLALADVLIDGRFILEQKDLTLHFRGSANQRILDVRKSLEKKRAVLYKRSDPI